MFLHRRAAASLLGLKAAATAVILAWRVLVLSSFAFALLQTDLFLHLFQVAVLDGLKASVGGSWRLTGSTAEKG